MAIQFLPWLRQKRDPFKPSSLNKGNDSNPAGVSKRLGQWSHTSRKRDGMEKNVDRKEGLIPQSA
ncbi:unnamed protein product [Sphenostylis stenocarpa]|uniref:Uncharacterized protein n=1 Tax=Sphenostylis stenocarpa TaxID=92480 RepID=A0AA86VHS1_9FABA|nr:unnamed protein product [Sphenostylis stenocarpa]